MSVFSLLRNLLLGGMLLFLSPSFLQAQDWVYTVRPGDNLWDLSERYLSSMRYWRALQEHNSISDPKVLQPGVRLKIPLAWLKVQPAPVKVLAVLGEVFVQPAGKEEEDPLLAGALLHIEDAVRSGPKSSATFVFADGSRLLLSANSHLILDVIRAYGETGMVDSRIRLKNGGLDTDVSPQAGSGSRFEIHTPGAITAVRGTRLRVANDTERQVASTEVLKGRVEVMAAGAVESVPAGFGTVVKMGEPPSLPRALLQAPALSGLPATMNQLPLHFIWPALSGANRYRTQLSENEDFSLLNLDVTVEKPELLLSDVPNGSYALRIRGIDDAGLEGFDAVHHFLLDVPPPKVMPPVVLPEPPTLLNPPPAVVAAPFRLSLETAVIKNAHLLIRWRGGKPDERYQVELAEDMAFATVVFQTEVGAAEILLDRPKPGLYYLRVRAVTSEGIAGEYTETQRIDVPSSFCWSLFLLTLVGILAVL